MLDMGTECRHFLRQKDRMLRVGALYKKMLMRCMPEAKEARPTGKLPNARLLYPESG